MTSRVRETHRNRHETVRFHAPYTERCNGN